MRFKQVAILGVCLLAASAATSVKGAERVVLGLDDSLTSGIPGTGVLTEAEIKAWLANPANHEVLEVVLPQGLALGESQVKGLAANPLTRAKIELGRQLYFDTRLSADNTVSCASCHHPQEGFSRHTATGVGIAAQKGGRWRPRPNFEQGTGDLRDHNN